MKTDLLLAFSSFHVDSDPNCGREDEYAICYEQLLRILPDNYFVIFVDNTVKDINELKSDRLKNVLGQRCKFFYDDNIGKTNKGLGELDMLIRVKKTFNLRDYKTVSYLTGRRIITCPYVFDKVSELKKDAIMSNPPLYSLESGNAYPTGDNLYNDMFFAMKTESMIDYCDYAQMQISQKSSCGSEQILYNFVNQSNLEYEWIESLGFIRNDWELGGTNYSKEKGNAQWI